jgi:hypothetical protein
MDMSAILLSIDAPHAMVLADECFDSIVQRTVQRLGPEPVSGRPKRGFQKRACKDARALCLLPSLFLCKVAFCCERYKVEK